MPSRWARGAVVDGDGLGDLEEADELESVQPLGSRLVAMDLREPGVDGRVGRDQAVDVGEPEEPADPVCHRVGRRRHQTGLAQTPDVELDVSSLDSHQRVQAVAFAPLAPAAQLVGVELMGVPGVAG